MTNFVSLICLEDESVWIDELRRLVELGGLTPDFRLYRATGVANTKIGDSTGGSNFGDPNFSRANFDEANLSDGMASDVDYLPSPNWAPPGGIARSGGQQSPWEKLYLTSPRAKSLAPPNAVTVSLTGDGFESGLVLPQDATQVLNLLTSQGSQGMTIGVHGLVSGVNSTSVAALVAGSLAEISKETSGESRDSLASSVTSPLGERGVCLVDFTGSTLPLSAYFSPLTGENYDWRDLISPGLPAPTRLAAGLPRWGEVAVLGGSGFLKRCQLPQAEAVLRGLRRAFSVVVVDFGSGKCLIDCPEDAEIWVAKSDLPSVLAWEDYPIASGFELAKEAPIYLVCQPFGGLSTRQTGSALEASHPNLPVFYPRRNSKNEKNWKRQGIMWPPSKGLHGSYRQFTKRLWNDLSCGSPRWDFSRDSLDSVDSSPRSYRETVSELVNS